MLINDTFLTHLTYNGVSTSHGGAVPHTRVSILYGRDVPTLYSRCLDLSRGRHLHILFFSRFHLHVLLFPPLSSISLRCASLTRRSGTFVFQIHLPRHDIITSLFPARRSDKSSIHDINEFLTIHDVLSFHLTLQSHVFLYTFLHTSNFFFPSSHF